MANLRALSLGTSGLGQQEIADTDTLNVGFLAPVSGDLSLGGAAGSNVLVLAGQTFSVSGATGALNLVGGADLLAGAGSILSGFDSIEGVISSNLVDKSASETITGQWTFQAQLGTSPTLIVKQALALEPPNTLLFQVQSPVGANLFSVDIEGDVVIAGGETVAGATVYTGDVTLGDGGNTIQLGSAAVPAVGDNVYINTTGTVDGSFSLTTANLSITPVGDVSTSGTITLTGIAVPAITMTGLDIGTALARAGTGYFTTLDITNLNSDGTLSNIWVVNEDASAVTAEQSAFILEAGDGVAELEVWQIINSPSSTQLDFRHKTNPANPKSLIEAGYTTYFTIDAITPVVAVQGAVFEAGMGCDVINAPLTVDTNGIDCGGGIDLDGTLSFDGVTASSIDTSGNNPLSITVGTNTLDVTAGLVDLATNVTILDVPQGVAFSIGGTVLTTANFTALNVDTLLDGSEADALHTHAKVTAPSINTSGMTQYYAGYISANNTALNTDVSAATGTFATASFAGVCAASPAVSGSLVTHGRVTVQFEAGIVGLVAGDPAILSWTTAGEFINSSVSAPGGTYITRVGVVVDTTSYAVDQRCDIIIHAQAPAKK